jgi:hypothetical protein
MKVVRSFFLNPQSILAATLLDMKVVRSFYLNPQSVRRCSRPSHSAGWSILAATPSHMKVVRSFLNPKSVPGGG